LKVKKALWVIFGIFFIPLICYQAIIVYMGVYQNDINLKEIGTFILMFELLLASVTAFYENGHFPIRYLMIFVVSALIFHLALNKSTMEVYSIISYTLSIIVLSLTYIYIKILNKKYTLSD